MTNSQAPERLAFLILAHRSPRQVSRLLARLHPYPAIVHIDARGRIRPFVLAIEERPENFDRVIFVKNRIKVSWGGFSMVEAMVEAARTGLEASPSTRRFAYLSGECYPIRPVEQFARMLDERPLTEFARAFPLLQADKWHIERIRRRHFFDIGRHLPAWRGIQSTRRAFRFMMHKLSPPATTNTGHSYVEVSGSQWMALTRPCLNAVVDAYDEGLFRRYKQAFAPDELAIQTFVHNSQWATKTPAGGPEDSSTGKVSDLPNYHHLKASMAGFFTDPDFAPQVAAEAFFIRKVDETASRRLMDHIDHSLLGLPQAHILGPD